MVYWIMLTALTAQPSSGDVAEAAPAGVREAHAQLEQILDQPLFQRWTLRQQRARSAPRNYPLLEGIREVFRSVFSSIGRFLKKVFSGLRFPSLGAPGDLVSTLKLFLWVGIGAIVLYFLVLIYRLVASRSKQPRRARVLTRDDVRTALETGDALALDGSQWLAEAQQLAHAGEFRAVYRAIYLALLSGMHSAGKIEYRRQRTNWTYVARFRGSDQEKSMFYELTSLFDEVWYGLKEARHANLDLVRAQVEMLVRKDRVDV